MGKMRSKTPFGVTPIKTFLKISREIFQLEMLLLGMNKKRRNIKYK